MTEYKIAYSSPKRGIVEVLDRHIDIGPYVSKHVAEIYCKGLNDGTAYTKPKGHYCVIEVEGK